ncbi:AAA+ superfamily predicted ATPase [Lachnospiraceae bacterium PFB1-21]
MLFYEIDIDIDVSPETESTNDKREQKNEFRTKAELFHINENDSFHIAIASIDESKAKVVLCAAVKKGDLSPETIERFLNAVDIKQRQISDKEITSESYCAMLSLSSRENFIESDRRILENLGIKDPDRYYSYRTSLSETVLTASKTKKELIEDSHRLLSCETLPAEIERIYRHINSQTVVGHPVQYMLLANTAKARDQMLATLLTALYQNGRIQSRRYTLLSLNNTSSLPEEYLEAQYEICTGSAMVISYIKDKDNDEFEFAATGTEIINTVGKVMRQHRMDVLTIFCLLPTEEKTKNSFLNSCGRITVVPLAQEPAFGERAKNYLRTCAKEYNVAPDRNLYKALAEGKGYRATDLDLIFDDWYDKKLKSTIYPQYSELVTVNKQFSLQKPKGSAIEELEDMIGLAEAKAVIHQALDFYKAQKIFKEKGFTNKKPAMHMVFTGNPGTAKTTVARLFAQIMKDNEMLSVGDLYEVGRADLVGKYVGWTATLIKEKFEAAQGSVLFIDEAYSLVDSSGSYGDEAINTIVQEMENHRDDTVVIFAGYPNEMEQFLNKNPGLRSRIAFHVPFNDYNSEELYKITSLLAKQKDISLESDVKDLLLPVFDEAMKNGDFGNGRFARNLFEKAIMKQASRLVHIDVDTITKADIKTLLAADFEVPTFRPNTSVKRIGF